MPRLGPIKRQNLIRHLKQLGVLIRVGSISL